MALLGNRFGDPGAFARTQDNWRLRQTKCTSGKLVALATAEPIVSVYQPDSRGYWRRLAPPQSALLSLAFANPIYFVGTALLVGYGAWRRWLNASELLLSVGLLLIPYLTRSYEMCMVSHGRFAAVVFPVYLVLGRILAALPLAMSMALLALSGALLGMYSAMFAAGYAFF
jgi:hypothetical protein